MNITINRDIEIFGNKACPLTVTRITGLQTIHVHGETVSVEQVTITEYPDCCTMDISRARLSATPEGLAAVERRIQETAVQGLVQQGIW